MLWRPRPGTSWFEQGIRCDFCAAEDRVEGQVQRRRVLMPELGLRQVNVREITP
jgi:hypothetical protein